MADLQISFILIMTLNKIFDTPKGFSKVKKMSFITKMYSRSALRVPKNVRF